MAESKLDVCIISPLSQPYLNSLLNIAYIHLSNCFVHKMLNMRATADAIRGESHELKLQQPKDVKPKIHLKYGIKLS